MVDDDGGDGKCSKIIDALRVIRPKMSDFKQRADQAQSQQLVLGSLVLPTIAPGMMRDMGGRQFIWLVLGKSTALHLVLGARWVRFDCL